MNPELSGPLAAAAEVVTLARDDALLKFNEYKAAVRVSRTQHDRMMKAVYGALAEGLGVINPRAAIIKAGLNERGYPKLAICRADFPTVFFKRHWNNQEAFFSSYAGRYLSRSARGAQTARTQFYFGIDQLPTIPPDIRRPLGYFDTVKAMVPIIPPAHRPGTHALDQYSVLWEVEQWQALPKPARPPGDPMLLKPLSSSGLYAVVAHWDLTDVEKMVLGAILGN
jgi:hypothetical protein